MIRYRIFHNDDLGMGRQICDGLRDFEAHDLVMQLKNAYPNNDYEIEKYNLIPPEGKGIGRDPDLH